MADSNQCRYWSVANDSRPTSIHECLREDGTLDVLLYFEFSDKEHELSLLERNQMLVTEEEYEEEDAENQTLQRKIRQRKHKTLRPYYFDDAGNTIFLEPEQTVWYLMYVKGPPLDDNKFLAKFRRRFRLPYSEFLVLLDKVKSAAIYFKRWMSKDAAGKKSSPIELLLLGALRYLGRGLTFDDLEEYTAINEETHRQFFHRFIDYGSEVLHDEYVRYPKNAFEYSNHRHEYDVAGLYGAGFSTDATNVVMWNCSHNLKQMNMGFKQSHTARTYNLSCNHRRQILYTTKGHPSRWNDKTLAIFDEFMFGIKSGKMLQDVTFKLFEYNETGKNIRERGYAGAWGLVDNGYHRWTCTQAPQKANIRLAEQRLSEFIESMRKDSECVFGILKGRWRILKMGIRLKGCEPADKIWLTCCALHNWLLFADGLSKKWSEGVRSSDYEGELGDNDPEDTHLAPFAIQRLSATEVRRFGSHQHYQESVRAMELQHPTMLFADTEENDEGNVQPTQTQFDSSGNIFINSLAYDDFRKRLVVHFDILHQQNKIVWPRSRKH